MTTANLFIERRNRALTLFLIAPKGAGGGAGARVRPVLSPSAAAIVLEGVAF